MLRLVEDPVRHRPGCACTRTSFGRGRRNRKEGRRRTHQGRGARRRGRRRIGEVANNDASEGAAIGATAGVVAGGRQARKNRQAQEEKAAEATAANADAAKAAGQQQLDTFKRGMGACLEGRGYTVK